MIEIWMTPWRGVRDHVADNENGGTAVDLFDQRRELIERSDSGLRIRPRHPCKNPDRGFRGGSPGEQPPSNPWRSRPSPIDDHPPPPLPPSGPDHGFRGPRL